MQQGLPPPPTPLRAYLLPAALVVAHVPLQLGAVGEGVAAVRAAVVVLAGLVPILDVLLQRGVALVAPGAVGAGVQLGEGVRGSWDREEELSPDTTEADGRGRGRGGGFCRPGYRFHRRLPSPLGSAHPQELRDR